MLSRTRMCMTGIFAMLVVVADLTVAQQTPDSSRKAKLEEITVTAERERAVAPPVVTIDVAPEELRREPARNAYDLVRRAAGIEVHEQGQGPGFASDVVIRGFTSDHSSDVLLVIDGVPINLPIQGHVEGYADWSILSAAAVSAFRVISGPASPLYGDFAFGGVVEVFTAADASGTAGGGGVTSYADVNGWTRVGQRAEEGGWLAALDGYRQQGWRQNDDYWLGNLLLRGWRRAGRGRVEGGLMVYGSTWNSPGFVSVARYNADDLFSAVDLTDGGSAGRLIGHGRYGIPLSATVGLDASVWGQFLRSDVFLNVPEAGEALHQTQEQDRRHAFGGQASLHWTRGTATGTLGVAGRADWTNYSLFETVARVQISPEQLNDANYRAGAVFGRWRGVLGSQFVYDLGGRIDVLHYASLDELNPVGVWQSATDVVASPKLGARYLINARLSLFGSLSRGFRGAIGVIAAPELFPTINWAKELGVAYVDERFHVQAALFQQDVSHERILDPITRDVIDVGKSRRRGIAFEAGAALTSGLRAIGELTVNDAKIKPFTNSSVVVPPTAMSARLAGPPLRPSFHDVPLPPGSTVPGVADYIGRVGLEAILSPSWAARGLVRFSGPYEPIGEPGVTTQPYALVEAGVSWRLERIGGVLDIDLLNLLDTKYPEIRASGFINPGVPRTLRVGLRFDTTGR